MTINAMADSSCMKLQFATVVCNGHSSIWPLAERCVVYIAVYGLELFNTLSTLAKWTPEEKAQQFPFYLAREASSWYSTAEVDKTKWDLISTAFTR